MLTVLGPDRVGTAGTSVLPAAGPVLEGAGPAAGEQL